MNTSPQLAGLIEGAIQDAIARGDVGITAVTSKRREDRPGYESATGMIHPEELAKFIALRLGEDMHDENKVDYNALAAALSKVSLSVRIDNREAGRIVWDGRRYLGANA